MSSSTCLTSGPFDVEVRCRRFERTPKLNRRGVGHSRVQDLDGVLVVALDVGRQVLDVQPELALGDDTVDREGGSRRRMLDRYSAAAPGTRE